MLQLGKGQQLLGESLTLGKNEGTHFDAFEIKGLRKLLRVS